GAQLAGAENSGGIAHSHNHVSHRELTGSGRPKPVGDSRPDAKDGPDVRRKMPLSAGRKRGFSKLEITPARHDWVAGWERFVTRWSRNRYNSETKARPVRRDSLPLPKRLLHPRKASLRWLWNLNVPLSNQCFDVPSQLDRLPLEIIPRLLAIAGAKIVCDPLSPGDFGAAEGARISNSLRRLRRRLATRGHRYDSSRFPCQGGWTGGCRLAGAADALIKRWGGAPRPAVATGGFARDCNTHQLVGQPLRISPPHRFVSCRSVCGSRLAECRRKVCL